MFSGSRLDLSPSLNLADSPARSLRPILASRIRVCVARQPFSVFVWLYPLALIVTVPTTEALPLGISSPCRSSCRQGRAHLPWSEAVLRELPCSWWSAGLSAASPACLRQRPPSCGLRALASRVRHGQVSPSTRPVPPP